MFIGAGLLGFTDMLNMCLNLVAVWIGLYPVGSTVCNARGVAVLFVYNATACSGAEDTIVVSASGASSDTYGSYYLIILWNRPDWDWVYLSQLSRILCLTDPDSLGGSGLAVDDTANDKQSVRQCLWPRYWIHTQVC